MHLVLKSFLTALLPGLVPPASGRLPMVAAESGGEGVLGGVADCRCDLRKRGIGAEESVTGEGHPPFGEVSDRRLSEGLLEGARESGS